MKKDPSLFKCLMLSAFLVVITSCTPESCLEETESFLKASFYSYSKPLNALPPDSLTVYGAGRDTAKIYASAQAIKEARLPLNPQTGSSVFIIRLNGISDTLSLSYSSYPHLISRECGYTYYHNITEPPAFTKNIIDSVWIKNNVITTKNEENIRIFY